MITRILSVLLTVFLLSAVAQDTVLIDWQKQKWDVSLKDNHELIPAKTPDGQTAMTIKVNVNGKNAFRSPLLKPGELAGRNFMELSFQIKNDGPTPITFIRFGTKDGKTGQVAFSPPDSKEWQTLTIPLGEAATTLSDLYLIQIRPTNICNFTMGPVTLKSTAMSIPLTPVPAVYANSCSRPPAVDGKLDDPAWKDAPTYSLNHVISAKAPLKEKTTFKILHDKNYLYVGAVLDCEDVNKLKATSLDWDQIFADDTFEVLINNGLNCVTYSHYAVNSKGARTAIRKYHDDVKDFIVTDTKWRPEGWLVKCNLTPSKWTVEMAIPIKSFGGLDAMPLIQVGRGNQTLREFSSFSPTIKFPRVHYFAALIPGTEVKTEIADATIVRGGKGKYHFSAKGAGKVKINAINEANTGFAATGNTAGFDFENQAESDGFHFLNVVADSGRRQMYTFNLALPVESKYGDIILNPMVKEAKWQEGYLTITAKDKIYIPENATPRTEKTIRMFAEELSKASGFELPIERGEGKTGITFKVTGSGPAEGYSLSVGDRIVLEGNDEPGLYYSWVTLMQILRGSMRVTDNPEFRKVTIKDWPDAKWRFITSVGNWKPGDPEDTEFDKNLPWYQEFFKRYVAGQKYNMVQFDLSMTYFFEKHPEIQPKRRNSRLVDKNFLKVLYDICQDHFIELIPAMEWGGHFWPHKGTYGHLFEPGFRRQGDSLVPGFFELYNELLDETYEGITLKYWNITQDEWWSHPPPELNDQYKGMARRDIFKMNTLKQHENLKARGTRALMYGDMLLKSHNGDKDQVKRGMYKVAAELPKDIIILNWTQQVDPTSNRTLHEYGFEVINCCNGFTPCPQDRDFIAGHGFLAYGLSHVSSGLINDLFGRQYGISAHCRSADYGWNIKRDPGTSLRDYERERLECILAMNSAKYNPSGGSKMTPVPVKTTHTLKELTGTAVSTLKSGDYGFIPMTLTNGSVAAINKNKPLEIEIGRNVSGFYVLQGLLLTPEERKEIFGFLLKYLRGTPLVVYEMNYDDGSKESVKLRFGVNVIETTTVEPRGRYMADCRYFWDGVNDTGQSFYMFQYEWVNPHPEKKIKSVTMRHAGNPGIPLVAAITAREIKDGYQK